MVMDIDMPIIDMDPSMVRTRSAETTSPRSASQRMNPSRVLLMSMGIVWPASSTEVCTLTTLLSVIFRSVRPSTRVSPTSV